MPCGSTSTSGLMYRRRYVVGDTTTGVDSADLYGLTSGDVIVDGVRDRLVSERSVL